MNSKEMEVALRQRIYSGTNDAPMQALKELAKLRIEACKERLLRCSTHHEMTGLQGEALAYAAVLKWIIEPLRDTTQKTSVDNQ